MTIVNKLENVLFLAKKLLLDEAYSDGEKALELLEQYLFSLEEWQAEYKEFLGDQSPLSESQKESIRANIQVLETDHALIMKKSEVLLGSLKDEIGKVNKSSSVIKKYISNPVVNTRPTIRKG